MPSPSCQHYQLSLFRPTMPSPSCQHCQHYQLSLFQPTTHHAKSVHRHDPNAVESVFPLWAVAAAQNGWWPGWLLISLCVFYILEEGGDVCHVLMVVMFLKMVVMFLKMLVMLLMMVLEDGCDDVEDLLLLATSRLMRGLTGPWGGHARLAKLPSPLKLMPCSKLQKSNFDRMLTKIRFQPILFIWVLKGSVIEKNTHLFCWCQIFTNCKRIPKCKS